MENQNDFINRTVLKLKRKYGKDELVAYLAKQLSEKDVEIGKLTSEVQHLTSEIEKVKIDNENNKEINKAAKIEARKTELFETLRNENKAVRLRNKQLTQTNNELVHKLCMLQKKYAKFGVND